MGSTTRSRRILIVLLGALMVYGLVACQEEKRDTPAAPVFDFRLRTIEEKATTISAIRDGKPAVVEFWGVT